MKILCDFDGTVAKNDVGSLLFRTFSDGTCYEIVQRWKEGKISSKECLVAECSATRVGKNELAKFVDDQQLDPNFTRFLSFCQDKGVEVCVVSDGLDFYVERILHNHNLDHDLEVRSNKLVFLNENKIKPEFPYFEKGCGRCGNCKGFHVREARKHHQTVIYVGDGLSDRCGAKEADIVFAKHGRDLLKYCQKNQIQHFEFHDFRDVHDRLIRILNVRR